MSAPAALEFKREAVARAVAALIREAPGSLAAHARLVHRDAQGHRIRPMRHHLEWVRVLEDRERYPYVVVVAPPGYAKSTWFSIIYPAWRIGASGGNVRIGLLSSTATQAVGFSKAVQDAVLSPEFRAAYPGVTPDFGRKFTEASWFVKGAPEGPNPTMHAVGLGGPVQGRRYDEIILDDPTTWEQARSTGTMEAQRRFLKGTLMERFPIGQRPPHGRGTRMVVVLTRWSDRDLVPTLVDDLDFKLVHMPAMGYWDRVEDPDTGEVIFGTDPLWPEVESLERLQEERENDELIFELVKQGNPKVLAGDVFDAATFQRGTPPSRRSFERVVQYVDTAGGKDRKRGDYFALATLGIRGGEVWMLDMVRKRLAAPEQERAVYHAHGTWDPDLIVIESANEGRALYQRLVLTGRLPLKEDNPTKDKEFRAIPLANAYRARRVWHPEGERWVQSYEAELQAFPEGAHDDQVDAASGAFNQSMSTGPRIRSL